MEYKKIGEILIESGVITEQDVNKVLEYQRSGKELKFGEILVLWGIVDKDTLEEHLAIQNDTKTVNKL